MGIRKNLLDLKYQKYLQFYIATLIVLFTYLVGIIIAFLTKQINIGDTTQVRLVGFITILVISGSYISLNKFNSVLYGITEEIKKF